jgi:hypothetical protein
MVQPAQFSPSPNNSLQKGTKYVLTANNFTATVFYFPKIHSQFGIPGASTRTKCTLETQIVNM